jgi:SAM-dependent methyltransferase
MLPAAVHQKLDAFGCFLARRGDRVLCECCGNTSLRFVAFGSPRRPVARCPHCGALERHRTLWPHIRAGLRPGTRVVHFAPEPILARNITGVPGVTYTAADLEPSSPGLASDIEIVAADITDQPWPDASFDVAVVNHVLEHVPDDRAAMRELRRVITPDGMVFSHHPFDARRDHTFEDPSVVSPAERLRVFGQDDHVRIYGRDLPARWTAAGFDVEDLGGGALAARPTLR